MRLAKTVLISFCLAALVGCACAAPAQKGAENTKAENAQKTEANIQKTTGEAWDETIVDVDTLRPAGYGLAMAADYCPVIFTGTCLEILPADEVGNILAKFSVESIIRKGIIDINEGQDVFLTTLDPSLYKLGEKHLVFGEPHASVWEEMPLYYVVEDIVAESGYNGDMIDMQGLEYAEILEKTQAYAANHSYNSEQTIVGAYCTSDDLGEICSFADCVVIVKTDKITQNSLSDRTSYDCSVVSALKGKAEGKIDVVAFKNCMETGKEYVLILSKHGEGADAFYSVAARRSVFEADSKDAEQISALLK